MSEEIKLLPCPFCGMAARLESNRDWHRIIVDHDEACIFLEPEVSMVPATDDQLSIVVADWNRRAALSQQPAPTAVPDGYALMTPEQLEQHTTTARECPPQSLVVLVSSLKRLHDKNSAAPAPVVQEPVAWQFFQDGRWWNGYDNIPDHRANTEAAGIPTRDLYAAPPAAEQPRMWMAKDERAIRELLAAINRDGGQHQHNVGIAQAARDALEEFDRIRQELAEQPDTVPVPRELLDMAAHSLSALASAGSREDQTAIELCELLASPRSVAVKENPSLIETIQQCLDAELAQWTADYRKPVKQALDDAMGRICIALLGKEDV